MWVKIKFEALISGPLLRVLFSFCFIRAPHRLFAQWMQNQQSPQKCKMSLEAKMDGSKLLTPSANLWQEHGRTNQQDKFWQDTAKVLGFGRGTVSPPHGGVETWGRVLNALQNVGETLWGSFTNAAPHARKQLIKVIGDRTGNTEWACQLLLLMLLWLQMSIPHSNCD